MTGRLLLHFDLQYVTKDHLGKDVFLVPHMLSERLGLEAHIVIEAAPANDDLPAIYRNIHIHRLRTGRKLRRWISHAAFIFRHARNYKVFIRFHLSIPTAALGCLYKWLHPRGFLYVKSDGTDEFASSCAARPLGHGMKSRIKARLLRLFFRQVDLISVETRQAYDRIRNAAPMGIDIRGKVVYMPNGFDDQLLHASGITPLPMSMKENLIITAGRIGHPEKNSEMLLQAAAQLKFRDNWKIIFIGPIEEKACRFQDVIDRYYRQYPYLCDKVVFTGGIFDKKQLWDWYNRAKIFVLTSPREGFPMVFPEAVRFSNYIISTDVGGARDVIANGYGEITGHGDPAELARRLQRIIDNELDLNALHRSVQPDSRALDWSRLIRTLSITLKD